MQFHADFQIVTRESYRDSLADRIFHPQLARGTV
jgi:hypothetical protein